MSIIYVYSLNGEKLNCAGKQNIRYINIVLCKDEEHVLLAYNQPSERGREE